LLWKILKALRDSRPLKCREIVFPLNNNNNMAAGELVCRNGINTNLAYGPKARMVRDPGNIGVFV
jgi:hypothetical protein